jgi:hypothetical protein
MSRLAFGPLRSRKPETRRSDLDPLPLFGAPHKRGYGKALAVALYPVPWRVTK